MFYRITLLGLLVALAAGCASTAEAGGFGRSRIVVRQSFRSRAFIAPQRVIVRERFVSPIRSRAVIVDDGCFDDVGATLQFRSSFSTGFGRSSLIFVD